LRIFMTGGTGFVGTEMTRALTGKDFQVSILTRSAKKKQSDSTLIRYVEGDPVRPGPWQEEVGGHDVVVNLAGASIFTRWTAEAKEEIRNSRILATRNVVEALSRDTSPGRFLFSASAVGFYGPRGEETVDETSDPGNDFLSLLSREWEDEALRARQFGVRVTLARFGIVLGKGGGALSQMAPIFKKGMGGPLGHGKQWFSWVHIQDLTQILLFLIDHKEVSGPINCTAPNQVRNAELTKTLAGVLHRPAIFRVPAFMVKMSMGDFASVVLTGQRVAPRRLQEAGYEFSYPELRPALENIFES
jgi:uncharacterized protein